MNNYAIVYVSNIGVNIFNPILFSCVKEDIQSRVPVNLDCITQNQWGTMKNEVLKIYSRTKYNIICLKLMLLFFGFITYYSYLFILVLILNLYFIFYARHIGLNQINNITKSLNETIFFRQDLKLQIKINCCSVYLYILKPTVAISEYLQSGVVISSHSDDIATQDLPTATAIQV